MWPQGKILWYFIIVILGQDTVRSAPLLDPQCPLYEAVAGLSRECLWTQPRDLLHLHADAVWMEFVGET